MKIYVKECRWGSFMLLRGDLISNYVNIYGEWSETELDLFRTLLSSDANCIEVGSNIGMHAVPLSKICHKGRVFCYEPQRPIYYALCGNLALNSSLNVVAQNLAVGAENGSIEIDESSYEEPWNYGSFSVSKGFNTEGDYQTATHKTTSGLVALDADPQLAALEHIDLLKIDAEGFEPAVLEGARKLILKHQPSIFVEANSEPVSNEILSIMRGLNYSTYWFVNRRYRQDNFNRVQIELGGLDYNMICIPNRKQLPGHSLNQAHAFSDLAAGVPILNSYA